MSTRRRGGKDLVWHISGRLDRAEDGVFEGWAINPHNEADRERLEVVIDGAVVGVALAGLYREDLDKANIRGGYAKFLYQVPRRYFDGKAHTIDMRHIGTGRSIDNMPTSFTLGVDDTARLAERRNWALQTLVVQDGTDDDSFTAALRARRRVALVSTFHSTNSFMAYQRALFQSLVDAGFVVVVIHASARHAERLETDVGPNCYAILKHNVGYDFGSWAVGTFALGARLDQVDEILLLNDSVIELQAGGLASLISRARSMGADAVGMTESYERQYHLQSYCIWLGLRVCRSSLLRMFLADCSFSSDKETVIREGELSFTARLEAEGFSVACLNPYELVAQRWLSNFDHVVAEINALPGIPRESGTETYKSGLFAQLDRIASLVLKGTPVNPGHFFWDTLIEACGFSLLKRELVILNPCNVPTHFRLGPLLSGMPDARRAILDLRRWYGGELVPAFWNGARAGAREFGRTTDAPPHIDFAPLPGPWGPSDPGRARAFVMAQGAAG
jgi:hypothetical protein